MSKQTGTFKLDSHIFEKVTWNEKNCDSNVRNERSKVGPWNLAVTLKSFSERYAAISEVGSFFSVLDKTSEVKSSLSAENENHCRNVGPSDDNIDAQHGVRTKNVALT